MPHPFPYFKVNICPFPLPHFASIFLLNCDPFADPIISLHSRDISLFDGHIWIYLPGPVRRIGQEYSANVASSTFRSNQMSVIWSWTYFYNLHWNNYLYFKGFLYICEEMIMMALLHMAGLENSEYIWKNLAQTSFKKYMPPPLPYFKVNICPFPLPPFASKFFAYLWSFRWPNYIVTMQVLMNFAPEIKCSFKCYKAWSVT
jgi:hypothetical protein